MSKTIYLSVFYSLVTLGVCARDLPASEPSAGSVAAADTSVPAEVSPVATAPPHADVYFGGPRGLAEVVGAQMNAIGGMSYQNPSFGGFTHTRWVSPGRLNAWTTTEISNDRKVYNKDGWFVTNTSEIGVRVNRVLVPTFVSYYGRQSNSAYKKAMASVGGGLRAALGNSTSVYSQYLFPDFLSFNHTKRLVFGLETYIPMGRKTMGYIGGGESIILFDQPRNGGTDHLVGMEASVKIGIVFRKPSE